MADQHALAGLLFILILILYARRRNFYRRVVLSQVLFSIYSRSKDVSGFIGSEGTIGVFGFTHRGNVLEAPSRCFYPFTSPVSTKSSVVVILISLRSRKIKFEVTSAMQSDLFNAQSFVTETPLVL